MNIMRIYLFELKQIRSYWVKIKDVSNNDWIKYRAFSNSLYYQKATKIGYRVGKNCRIRNVDSISLTYYVGRNPYNKEITYMLKN